MKHIKASFFVLITVVITVFLLVNMLMVSAQSAGSIAYGETVTGNITDDAPVQDWLFEGSAGDIVSITMNAVDLASGGLDSYLQLLDASGNLLAENDDASSTTINAEIANFTLLTDGTYTIRATRFGLETGLAVGEYELTLSLASDIGDGGDDTPTSTEAGQAITYNTPISGELNRQNFEDSYVFNGQEGDIITVRMERTNDLTDLDPFLRLLDNENRELERNDDSPEGIQSSEITGYQLPYTGTYTIVATRYGFESGTSSGEYSLEIITDAAPSEAPDIASTEAPPTEQPSETATPEATPPPTELSEGGSIVYGESVTGNAPASYSFDGQAGDVVTISVKRSSGDFNPSVSLLDEGGSVLADNAEFNGAADARIVEFSLPDNGTYFIEVEQDTSAVGEYVLYLFTSETGGESPVVEAPTATPEPVEQLPSVDLSNATLAITLSWDGTADFDFDVTDPDGNIIDYITTNSDSGGVFGGDANGGCIPNMNTPAESVYWEGEPPTGTYTIGVAFVFPCEAESPVSYTVTVTVNGEVVETFEDELNEGEYRTYDYSLQ